MAIADLTPSIEVCFKDNCEKISITDTTGVYDASTNTGGWENAATVLAASVTALEIVITPPGGTAITTDVLSQLPDPVTGEFTFNDIELDAAADGEYKIEYTVTTAGGSKTVKVCIFSTCVVRCCIDSLWASLAANMSEESDCGCGCTEPEDLMSKALFAESLFKAIRSSGACVKETQRDNLLTKLQRLCAIEDCNCS